MRICSWLPFAVLQFISITLANTEKTVFIAPSSITIPNLHPNLDDLCLDSLTPESSSIHSQLPVAFPSAEHARGNQSWYLLDRLRAGQRYEVRVCWIATQPTDFWLDTYSVTDVFDTPELISALAEYSGRRQETSCHEHAPADRSTPSLKSSLLFLRIHSAAHFYTTDKTLMQQPPAVGVDIILDPYVLNIFPRSLLPTGALIIAIAIGGWALSGMVWAWLQSIARAGEGKSHGD